MIRIKCVLANKNILHNFTHRFRILLLKPFYPSLHKSGTKKYRNTLEI